MNVQSMHKNTAFGVQAGHIHGAIGDQNKKLHTAIGAHLNTEQEQAIRHILRPQQISAVIGYAGAGKSTLLAAANAAWKKQGLRVIGGALSGKAADGLENASGIKSRTLASLELSWKDGYSQLQPGDILVIDEAGMVGTRQML